MAVLENLNKTFPIIIKFILKHLQTLYKAAIQNLGQTNKSVLKYSEFIVRQMHEICIDKMVLVQILVNMIQYNSNLRLKPALID